MKPIQKHTDFLHCEKCNRDFTLEKLKEFYDVVDNMLICPYCKIPLISLLERLKEIC